MPSTPGPIGRGRKLRERSLVLRAVRDLFFGQEFIEIEPSLVVEAPGMELHIDCVEVGERYLISSPEFQLKRLLCEGYQRIFALCRCFRAGESGLHHSVEFSMLEWYRAEAELSVIAEDCEQLLVAAAMAVRSRPEMVVDGRVIDVTPPFERVSVLELFRECLGCDIDGEGSAAELKSTLSAAGVDLANAEHWDDLFYTAFVNHLEPALAARDRPVFVTDWPAHLGALARRRDDDPSWVERFELYVGGVELANAFGELTDSVEQRRRFEHEQAQRRQRGKAVYGLDERFLLALDGGMPNASGIALGVDRLVMLATGEASISGVQAFGDGEV